MNAAAAAPVERYAWERQQPDAHRVGRALPEKVRPHLRGPPLTREAEGGGLWNGRRTHSDNPTIRQPAIRQQTTRHSDNPTTRHPAIQQIREVMNIGALPRRCRPFKSYGNYPSQISRAVQNTTPECECPLSLSSRETGSSSRLLVVGPASCYKNQ